MRANCFPYGVTRTKMSLLWPSTDTQYVGLTPETICADRVTNSQVSRCAFIYNYEKIHVSQIILRHLKAYEHSPSFANTPESKQRSAMSQCELEEPLRSQKRTNDRHTRDALLHVSSPLEGRQMSEEEVHLKKSANQWNRASRPQSGRKRSYSSWGSR